MALKLCRSCNLELPENRKFCEFCGSNVLDVDTRSFNRLRCPTCSEEVQPTWKFCKNCRANLVAIASQPPAFVTESRAMFVAPSVASSRVPNQLADESLKIAIRCLLCRQLVDEDSAFCEYCGANMDAGAALTESSGPNVFAKNATRGNRVSEKVTPIDIGASSGPEFAPEEVRAREEQAVTPKIATPEIVVANEPYLSQVSPVYVQEVDIQDQDGVLSERFLRSKVVAAGATPPMVSAHEAEPSKWKWWHALFAAGLFIFIIAIIGAGALYLWLQRSPSVKSSSQSSPSSYRAEATLPIPEGMVYVRGGTFLMGRDDGDEYERPAHKVTVAPFFLDKFEVTCEQYQKFLDATQRVAPTSWRAGRFPAGAAKLPVTGVTWDDANAYAGWAGKRLPTEEEWEFAARGSSGGKYPWGKEWRAKAANAGDSSAGRLADVGSYPDGNSSDGVMDLIGNAWEWTSSDLAAYPGGQLSSISRKDLKVIRGGSWKEEKDEATVTYRGYLASRGAKDYSATGFRCVKESDITSKQD